IEWNALADLSNEFAWLKARAGAAGPALLAVSGVGLLLAAAILLREYAAGVVYDPGGHIVAGMLFFPATAVAFIVLSHRLARSTLASPGRQHPCRWCPRCRHGAGHHRAGLLRRGAAARRRRAGATPDPARRL